MNFEIVIILFNVKLARTIWIYGPSGIGKSTWTNDFLKENGYSGSDICFKKSPTTFRPKLWFHLPDDRRSGWGLSKL